MRQRADQARALDRAVGGCAGARGRIGAGLVDISHQRQSGANRQRRRDAARIFRFMNIP
jgi:hypothetical protein